MGLKVCHANNEFSFKMSSSWFLAFMATPREKRDFVDGLLNEFMSECTDHIQEMTAFQGSGFIYSLIE